MQAPGPCLVSFFGLTFDKQEHLPVTELFGTATTIPAGGNGALSSFTVGKAGNLLSISSHMNDGGTAACWIALEPPTGKYAYVANNLSASISSYSVGPNGSITLLSPIAAKPTGQMIWRRQRKPATASFMWSIRAIARMGPSG